MCCLKKETRKKQKTNFKITARRSKGENEDDILEFYRHRN